MRPSFFGTGGVGTGKCSFKRKKTFVSHKQNKEDGLVDIICIYIMYYYICCSLEIDRYIGTLFIGIAFC